LGRSGGDDAHIHIAGSFFADPFILAFLQDAKKLALQFQWNSPTSSRSRAPPLAASNRPARSLRAPVNEPRACPKNSRW
jgi:hypothetical protein